MKKLVCTILSLFPLIALAQNNFFISGTGSAFKDGDIIYLTYKQQGKVVFDSTFVKLGTFAFSNHVDDVSVAYIRQNESPMLENTVSESIEFYIEPGNISIVCNDLLNNAAISGTIINEDDQLLKKTLRSYNEQLVTINKAFYELPAERQKDINSVAAYRAAHKKIMFEMAPLQFQFIDKHPNSYISLVTLKQLLNNKDLLPEINRAYANLSMASRESVFGLAIGHSIASLKKTDLGMVAYNFTLPDVKGKPVSLSDFKGKYILIDFWASWCLPCREENPNIILAYNKFKNKGFTILGVSIDNNNKRNEWLKAINDDKLTWTQVLDGEKDSAKIKTLYGITTIPSNLLIDPTGKIIAKDLKDKVLLNKLAALLDTQ